MGKEDLQEGIEVGVWRRIEEEGGERGMEMGEKLGRKNVKSSGET